MTHSDIDQRRRRVVEIVIDVIAREGLEAATIRRIAAEVGYSTAVITYYFADKRELLLETYRVLGEHSRTQFDAIAARDPTDLAGYCASGIDTHLPAWERG